MYNIENGGKQEKGSLCHICTGCGRCFGGGKGIRIIMAEEQTGADDQMPAGSQTTIKTQGSWLAAVDIGTTTIAMVLYDEEGREQEQFAAVNPQSVYGADVLSRIQASADKAAADKMKEGVREVLSKGLERFRRRIKLLEEADDGAASCVKELQKDKGLCGEERQKEEIPLVEEARLRMVIAANTTMVYLLMGFDTEELGKAPFHASHLETVHTMIEGVPAVILPGLSAFVGADIMAGIYASGMAEKEELTLLVDLGTNGEMVLGNSKRMLACATAAGPAFEGGANRGIWGADMISLTARLLREGIVDETGLMADEWFEEGIRIGNVLVTQQAVRNLQLAKGAVAAGIHILAERYGLQKLTDISRVVLAGGFGYFLNGEDAAAVGLLPEELTDRVQTAGNTALAGTRRFGRKWIEQSKAAERHIDGRQREDVRRDDDGRQREDVRRDIDGRQREDVRRDNDGRQREDVQRDIDDKQFADILSRTEVLNLAELPEFQEKYLEFMDLKPVHQ